ncbi:Aspartyl-tRNA(Asn) amidotransferase subunit C @ Glutamyl-tRNA(Gln) amidotransferase subunit C [hydrothermal vent metagenome]|uniref:Aspartyl-tRNA(Asn) amidotransferase subunit C @ Glutamyl-tRNA(Gln) amidotransferase subunit C n=1 Tax=hydrothermal vent metagenome TaxID=652676 RepID=A0A3B1AZE5_9ZZZZ
MSLERADVKKIAHLAQLDVGESRMDDLAADLSNILDLVAQMSNVNTDDVIPMAHPLHMVQRLRTDEVTETDHRETFQANAPQTEAGLYLVPQVIE